MILFFFIFFFQAEDGIRDFHVTGVQTCALPISDRKKDMLLVNGINVYPREIEEVLYQFPGVKEAAVIGRPDPRKGEQPIAFVAAMDGLPLDEATIQQFVRKKMADYKVPRRVVILPT